MSENAHRVRAEPDRIATPRLVAIAAVTLAIFLAASLATGWGMEWWRGRLLRVGAWAGPWPRTTRARSPP